MVKKYIILIGLLSVLTLFTKVYIFNMTNNSNAKIWSPHTPYSLDPLDYDALAHHICFRSVYSSLVSDYRVGQISGQISKIWTVNNNQTIWSFEIRNNLFFENGERINPEAVALSLNRAAFLMKNKNSQAGLLKHLEHLENFKKL